MLHPTQNYITHIQPESRNIRVKGARCGNGESALLKGTLTIARNRLTSAKRRNSVNQITILLLPSIAHTMDPNFWEETGTESACKLWKSTHIWWFDGLHWKDKYLIFHAKRVILPPQIKKNIKKYISKLFYCKYGGVPCIWILLLVQTPATLNIYCIFAAILESYFKGISSNLVKGHCECL